jgi:predicted HTH domain antitoxin
MSLTIPDQYVRAAHMTEDELRCEIAVLLFQRERLSLAKAAELAAMDRLQFQHLLASRRIPVHYGEADLEQDVHDLRELGQL